MRPWSSKHSRPRVASAEARADARPLDRRAQRTRSRARSRPCVSTPTSARSRASTLRLCPPSLRRFDCRNNRLAETRPAAGRLRSRPSIRRRAAGAGGGSACFSGTSTAGILQTELAYRARDPVTGALPADFDYGATHNSFSVADYLRRRLRARGTGGGGVLRLRLERQGVRLGAAHDRGGSHRCRARGRCRLALPHHALRLSLAAALLARALPPLRRRARRHLHRRSRRVRAARTAVGQHGGRRCAAARRRRIERRLSHVGAASRRPRRAPRHASGAARMRASSPAPSTTSTCTAPARRATIAPRATR